MWALMATGCAPSTTERLRLPPLETVAHVDLARYLGTWYEIASFPHTLQRGCTATTATYSLRSDGDIDVLNRCRKGSIDGEEKTALGRARVVDRSTNAKLEVSFFRPFWGDYWIIYLDKDYQRDTRLPFIRISSGIKRRSRHFKTSESGYGTRGNFSRVTRGSRIGRRTTRPLRCVTRKSF